MVIAGGDGREQTGKQFIAKVAIFQFLQFLPFMLKLENIHSLCMPFKNYYNRISTIRTGRRKSDEDPTSSAV